MSGIRIEGVARRYGGTAVLKGVSLEVAAGEFVALLGPSGCGKSTLMRLIAGIDRPDAGRILIQGRDVTGLRPADRDVAMVFQSYALYPHLTVEENIAVPLAMRRLSAPQRLPLLGRWWPGSRAARRAIHEEVGSAALALGLGSLLDRRPGQLSGGQRQRVALARAIVRHPAAFLMDEPLSNLDAALRVHTRREIVEIHRRVGAATLYVTHDQTEALTMADRVAVMQGGEILQVAGPRAIYADPEDLRVACFIGSPRINTLEGAADSHGLVRLGGFPSGLRLCGAEAGPAPVTLAVRPEDLYLSETGGLPAEAAGLEFLGESLLLHARLAGGAPLVCRLPPSYVPDLPPGSPVRLGFDPARALLFDARGKRLRDVAVVPEPALV